MPRPDRAASSRGRIVVLASGGGSNLAALVEASRDPTLRGGGRRGRIRPARRGCARDRPGGWHPDVRGRRSRLPGPGGWDAALTAAVAEPQPGPRRVSRVPQAGRRDVPWPLRRPLREHPQCAAPELSRVHGPRDALAYGVRITGATLFFVDAGWTPDRSSPRSRCRLSPGTPRRRSPSGSRSPSASSSWTPSGGWSARAGRSPEGRSRSREQPGAAPSTPSPRERVRQDRPGRARPAAACRWRHDRLDRIDRGQDRGDGRAGHRGG